MMGSDDLVDTRTVQSVNYSPYRTGTYSAIKINKVCMIGGFLNTTSSDNQTYLSAGIAILGGLPGPVNTNFRAPAYLDCALFFTSNNTTYDLKISDIASGLQIRTINFGFAYIIK